MATRLKPAGCCAPKAVKPMPKGKLATAVSIAKALADPNRIEIVRFIARQDGPACACDIVEHLDLSQPTVSHHLKILKNAGLLSRSRQGLWSFYEVDPTGIDVLESMSGLLTGRAMP